MKNISYKNFFTYLNSLLVIFCFFFCINSCNNNPDTTYEEDYYKLLDFKAEQSLTSANNVTLTWRDSKNYDKYSIYYNTTNDSSTAKKYTYYGYVSKEYDSNNRLTGFYKGSREIPLSQSGTYYFWIKAVDGANKESLFSKSVSCEFTYTSIDKPIDLSVKQSETSKNNVTISWRDSIQADKYSIYYNTTDDSSTAEKYTYYGYVSKEYDSNNKLTGFYKGSREIPLSQSGTYYFWIKAVDGNGNESDFSQGTSCIFTLQSLNAPVDLYAEQSKGSYNNVIITWRDSIQADKYSIYYNTTNDSSTAKKYTYYGYVSKEYDSKNKLTGFYKGSREIPIPQSGTYYFWIKAVDGNGNESDFSLAASCNFVLQNLNIPVDVSSVQSLTEVNKVTISWRDSIQADKYSIYYNTTNDSSTAKKYTYYGYVSKEYDSNNKLTGFYKGSREIPLSQSGTYYFWIKAVDGNGNESDFSTVCSCSFIAE